MGWGRVRGARRMKGGGGGGGGGPGGGWGVGWGEECGGGAGGWGGGHRWGGAVEVGCCKVKHMGAGPSLLG